MRIFFALPHTLAKVRQRAHGPHGRHWETQLRMKIRRTTLVFLPALLLPALFFAWVFSGPSVPVAVNLPSELQAIAPEPAPAPEGSATAEAAAEQATELELADAQAGSAQLPAAAEPEEQTLTVAAGDTLIGLLTEAGVARGEAHAALSTLTELFPPSRLRPGQELVLRLDPGEESRLVSLEISPAPGHSVSVERRDDGWHAEEARLPEHPHLAQVEAVISGGVFPTLVSAGLPPTLAYAVVRAYSHRVDFQRDLRPGDRIAVAFERMRSPDGTLLRHGRVLYAGLTLSGQTQEIWRHEGPEGEVGWYDAQGMPLAGGFLRTPLNGVRMSSGYGMRRHPILGYNRMHRGVDFAAPTGTPVYAASDGVVHSIRTERGYGRVIRLRHGNGALTLYAHLSQFAPGLTAGTRVRQGQTIGRVGSTGMSTGPHLHYELHVNGQAVNPATSRLPAQPALAGRALLDYQLARSDLNRQRARLARGTTEVALAPQ
jgi:murein DD-endopeptidase MepM/ murein hydrolase activator NlpD